MKKILKIIFKYVFVFLIGFLACTCSIKTNTKINVLKTNSVKRANLSINTNTFVVNLEPSSFGNTCASLITIEASPNTNWNGATLECTLFDKNALEYTRRNIVLNSNYKLFNLLLYFNVEDRGELSTGYQLISFNDDLTTASDTGLTGILTYYIDDLNFSECFYRFTFSNDIRISTFNHSYNSQLDFGAFALDEYMQEYVYTKSLYEQQLTNQINQLTTQINLLNSNIARLQNEINTKDEQINSLNRQLTNIQNAYTELQTQYNDLNLSYTTLSTQYQSLSAEHQQLQQDYESIHYAFENMRSHLAVVEREFEEYKSMNTNFSNPLDAIKKILSTFAPLLDKELFPHITIGNILLIPITFKIVEMFLTLVGGKK